MGVLEWAWFTTQIHPCILGVLAFCCLFLCFYTFLLSYSRLFSPLLVVAHSWNPSTLSLTASTEPAWATWGSVQQRKKEISMYVRYRYLHWLVTLLQRVSVLTYTAFSDLTEHSRVNSAMAILSPHRGDSWDSSHPWEKRGRGRETSFPWYDGKVRCGHPHRSTASRHAFLPLSLCSLV